MAKRRGYHTLTLDLGGKKKKKKGLKLYTSQRVVDAAHELLQHMNVYQYARFRQIVEAVYDHGKKDGAREVFESVDSLKSDIPHRLPGRPRGPRR